VALGQWSGRCAGACTVAYSGLLSEGIKETFSGSNRAARPQTIASVAGACHSNKKFKIDRLYFAPECETVLLLLHLSAYQRNDSTKTIFLIVCDGCDELRCQNNDRARRAKANRRSSVSIFNGRTRSKSPKTRRSRIRRRRYDL
jgi:hypothetical protein